jgi:hypothetical protein
MALLHHHSNSQVDSPSWSLIIEEPLGVQAPIEAIELMYKNSPKGGRGMGVIYRRRLNPA